MENKKKHYNITVKGRVQGVWFRKYAQEKAYELNLKGFIRNQPDGSVYVEAEGIEEILLIFLDWLYEGSPLSRVHDVAYNESSLENFSRFEIRS